MPKRHACQRLLDCSHLDVLASLDAGQQGLQYARGRALVHGHLPCGLAVAVNVVRLWQGRQCSGQWSGNTTICVLRQKGPGTCKLPDHVPVAVKQAVMAGPPMRALSQQMRCGQL